jgi:5-methylthioadenosine/S-adenosylhomocysteine deaminase
MNSTAKDCVISARWIVPVVPTGKVLENHSLIVRNGLIDAIVPTSELPEDSLTHYLLPNHLVTAGFINTHGHAAMTLLRGYADDLELMDWLNNHIWPVEGRWVSEEFVYDGTSLAVAEMIGSGTTTAVDTYFFPDAVARAFSDHGFRGQVCMPVVQFGNAWAATEQEHISQGLALIEQLAAEPLITTALAPHAPYTVSDEAFSAVVKHAADLDIPIHLHLHESGDEVSDSRPMTRMQELGVLACRLQAVHMTQLTAAEIDLVVDHDIQIAHCPESNMKLASGICPVSRLAAAGVNVALGTDGAASNNNLDMLEEARSASLLAKVSTLDATSIGAVQALEMATINGARFLGLDARIGSLEVGKSADIIAVDFSGIGLQPVHNPISQLIYAATGSQVSHTWINGHCVYADSQYTQLDSSQLASRVETWRKRICDGQL